MRAVGFGGGQKGGDLSNTSLAERIYRTPFAPIIPYFSLNSRSSRVIDLDNKRYSPRNYFMIQWEDPSSSRNSLSLPAVYVENRDRENEKDTEVIVKMEYSDRDKDEIIMYIDNDKIQVFSSRFGDRWRFVYDNVQTDSPDQFIKNIHAYFSSDSRDPSDPTRQRARVGPSGVAVPSGKSSFDNFDQIKKLYEDQLKGGPFPKAYCIARAMTLMTPLFPSETGQNGPYYSQICSSNLDFEAPKGDYMPRAGRQPKANVYLRSLVSLYYDDYMVRGGQVEFTQSESSRASLRQGSTLLARLYNITSGQDTFIDSTTPFKAFTMCGKETLLQYRNENFRRDLYNKVIIAMIKKQEEHTVNVNKFLNRMFKIVMDPRDGKPTMKFSDELKVAGRQSVNKMCAEVRNFLMNYYLTSEALYIQGVNMIRNNPSAMAAL